MKLQCKMKNEVEHVTSLNRSESESRVSGNKTRLVSAETSAHSSAPTSPNTDPMSVPVASVPFFQAATPHTDINKSYFLVN